MAFFFQRMIGNLIRRFHLRFQRPAAPKYSNDQLERLVAQEAWRSGKTVVADVDKNGKVTMRHLPNN